MSGYNQKNFYDILDIPQDATAEEVEAAYVRAKATYGENSVALYSLYSDTEKDLLLQDINEAYSTLCNETKRDAYDAAITVAQHQRSSLKPHKGSLQADTTPVGTGAASNTIASTSTLTLKNRLHSMDELNPVAAEQYRVLYTRLENISINKSHKVFAITSAIKGEGKTLTSLNLAYVMAHDFKKKVVLVEFDLRKPSMLKHLSANDTFHTIYDVVNKGEDVMSSLSRLKDTSLYFLPAVTPSVNSVELLGSQRMKSMLKTLSEHFDYVVVDCPPILHMADMNIIARIVNGLILVARAGKTPKDMVVKAARSLNGSNIVGIVLNDAEVAYNRYYYK